MSDSGKGPLEEDNTEKLQKVLARAGLGSRREMERSISSGKVKINGKLAKLGDRVKLTDTIEFDGKKVAQKAKDSDRKRVILYNKPEGEICSRSDPEGRRTVYENLPRLKHGRWISVGRLDFNTSGALLFTSDGELANKLMHPSSNIDREYLIRILGDVDEDMLKRLKDGVMLEDGVARFTDIQPGNNETRKPEDKGNSWFYCVVMEGRNREVRRLWESQGVRVSRLKRVRFGHIFIPSHVRVGQWIELNDKEVNALYETAGLNKPEKAKYSPLLQRARDRHLKKLRSSSHSGRGKGSGAAKPRSKTGGSSTDKKGGRGLSSSRKRH